MRDSEEEERRTFMDGEEKDAKTKRQTRSRPSDTQK